VPSTIIMVSFPHIPSQQFCYKFKLSFTFIDLFLQVHLQHIFILMSFFHSPWPVQLYLQSGGNRVLHSSFCFSASLISCWQPTQFFRFLSKAAYTPCRITTNHCRIVLMDIHLIFFDHYNSISTEVFTTASVKTLLSLIRLSSSLVDT
jgi:hypothetical protein